MEKKRGRPRKVRDTAAAVPASTQAPVKEEPQSVVDKAVLDAAGGLVDLFKQQAKRPRVAASPNKQKRESKAAKTAAAATVAAAALPLPQDADYISDVDRSGSDSTDSCR